MTPRPADEARRALREARERERAAGDADAVVRDADPVVRDADAGEAEGDRDRAGRFGAGAGAAAEEADGGREHPVRADAEAEAAAADGDRSRPSRPGDLVRAALRDMRTVRRTGADAAAETEPGEGGLAGAPGVPLRTAPAVPGRMPPHDAARPEDATAAPASTVPPSTAPGSAASADATTTATRQAATPPTGSPADGDSRPGDVAREALRAARRKAQADRAAEAPRRPAPTRRPHPTGAASRTPDARARAVRDFAASAFRLPPETDPAQETPLPIGTPEGGTAPSGDEPTPAPPPATAPAQHRHAPRPTTPAATHPPTPAPAPAPRPTTAPDPHPAPAPHPAPDSRPAPEAPRFSTPPATPRTPRSMAAPNRDGDLRRTFPALPPRLAGEAPAGTWWGNAWLTALEEGALDAARLARGRGYAEQGHVDAITVTPGLVLAYVQGSRPRPYRVQVRLRTLADDDWQRFLEAAVERPGHIAALLDKELPHSLADCGVALLPGPGDLAPQCSCPDSGHPCKHAAALCYQTARLLDADPFVLLLLRGRGERELLDALSRLNAARAARAAQDRGPAPLPGVRAGTVLAHRVLPPLPAPLPPPPHPEQPPAYPAAPGGPDPLALDQLATDAAARAHALLTTGRDPVGALTLWQDAVRLAAARPGSGLTAGTRALYASLAEATGRDTADLARAVAAWRQGGPHGLDVLEEPWDPPAGRFDRARPLLLAADFPAFRPWRNRLTHPHGHIQLRLGRSGLWYAYESEPAREDWWPRGTPDLDPVGALTGLGTRPDL